MIHFSKNLSKLQNTKKKGANPLLSVKEYLELSDIGKLELKDIDQKDTIRKD